VRKISPSPGFDPRPSSPQRVAIPTEIAQLAWAIIIIIIIIIIIVHRRIMDSNLEEIRRVGKHKLRWLDDVVEDLRTLGIQIWWLVATDRQVWKVLREVETHSGL
jgi:hypothetical protein